MDKSAAKAKSAGPRTSPTPKELISKAEALRPLLLEQQEASEARGYYSQEIHEAFLDAGFYHILTPKRYGGLEYDLKTFFKVIVEIARGDPGVGWCLCLGHGHTLTTAGYFPQEAQDEVFRGPKGYFRASHTASKMGGTARRVEDGYVVNATSPYESGVPYSSHATVNVTLEPATDGGRSQVLAVLVPDGQFTMLEDWGGDATLGLRSSGSNTVVVSDQLVPAHYAVPFDWMQRDHGDPTPGYLLHGNPMYLAPVISFFFGEIVSVAVGAAKAALDEYEHILRTRTTYFPPIVPRYQEANSQREFGLALTMADAGEALLLHAAELYMEYCQEWAASGKPFTPEMDSRLGGMMQRGSQMAAEAVEMLFRSAGSTAGMRGQRLQRYYRDISMFRGHNTAQYLANAQSIAATYFKIPRAPRATE